MEESSDQNELSVNITEENRDICPSELPSQSIEEAEAVSLTELNTENPTWTDDICDDDPLIYIPQMPHRRKKCSFCCLCKGCVICVLLICFIPPIITGIILYIANSKGFGKLPETTIEFGVACKSTSRTGIFLQSCNVFYIDRSFFR